jgi:tRNA-splicing ligase RtcB (3'-phosphate/5'-hydroxy nucleic acid ligase)
MSEQSLAPVRKWLSAPIGHDVSEAIERLRQAPDVQQIAVMPDVHLAADVCIGIVIATSRLIYPQAVGGDIGCGMLAVGFDVEATALHDPGIAGRLLAGLGRAVPARRRNRRAAIKPPSDLEATALSHPSLNTMRQNEGVIEFATLGSGNHFIELQSDDDGRLWLMVHSGSRGIGPAIRDHHLGHAETVGGGLHALDATSEQGVMYLRDVAWARRWAPWWKQRSVHACIGRQPSRRTTTMWRSNVTEGVTCGSIGRARCRLQPANPECFRGRWATLAFTLKDEGTRQPSARVRTVPVAR